MRWFRSDPRGPSANECSHTRTPPPADFARYIAVSAASTRAFASPSGRGNVAIPIDNWTGMPASRLTLLLLHEHGTDVSGKDLERLKVRLFEGQAVGAVGDIQDAPRLVIHQHRHGHERGRAVPAARPCRRVFRPTHEQ